jgi:hypothetical protein
MPLLLRLRHERFEKERTNNLIKDMESGTKHTADRWQPFVKLSKSQPLTKGHQQRPAAHVPQKIHALAPGRPD